MSTLKPTEFSYRTVVLPGLGRVQVPSHLSDAQILAEVMDPTAPATPKKKTKKKP